MTTEHPGHSMAEIILANLRRAGWTVAVHNDFRLQGQPHTFWLLTHEATRRYAKGEGTSDLEALEIVAHEAALATDAPLAIGEPTLTQVTPTLDALPGRPWLDLTEARRTIVKCARALEAGRSEGAIDVAASLDGPLIAAFTKHLGDAIAVIEDRLAAPDAFEDGPCGDCGAERCECPPVVVFRALPGAPRALVVLPVYQQLVEASHAVNHQGLLEECPVPVCKEVCKHRS